MAEVIDWFCKYAYIYIYVCMQYRVIKITLLIVNIIYVVPSAELQACRVVFAALYYLHGTVADLAMRLYMVLCSKNGQCVVVGDLRTSVHLP